jgi:hypothetical protein
MIRAEAAKHPHERIALHDENDGPGVWGRSHQYINDAKSSAWVVSRSFRLDRSILPPSEGNATLNSNWECYRRAAADPMLDADIRVHAFVGNRNGTRRTSARGSASSHAMLRPVGGLHHRVRALLESGETDQRRLTGSLRPRVAGKKRLFGQSRLTIFDLMQGRRKTIVTAERGEADWSWQRKSKRSHLIRSVSRHRG